MECFIYLYAPCQLHTIFVRINYVVRDVPMMNNNNISQAVMAVMTVAMVTGYCFHSVAWAVQQCNNSAFLMIFCIVLPITRLLFRKKKIYLAAAKKNLQLQLIVWKIRLNADDEWRSAYLSLCVISVNEWDETKSDINWIHVPKLKMGLECVCARVRISWETYMCHAMERTHTQVCSMFMYSSIRMYPNIGTSF